MIEVKVPGFRDGRGFIKLVPATWNATTQFKTGRFVKLDTAAWSTEALGTPGKAYVGAAAWVVATSGDGIDKRCYPYNKLIYKPEDSEVDSDYAVSGDGIIVYKNGQYETDQYNTTDVMSACVPGTLLYLDASSCLCTGLPDDHAKRIPRAIYIGSGAGYSAKQSDRAMLWFELIEQIYMTSGMLGITP